MNYKLQAIWLIYYSSLFTHDCIYAGDRVCDCHVASLLAMTEEKKLAMTNNKGSSQ